MYVIGIDGGGSKTTAILAREDGKIIDIQHVGPTNPNSVGIKEASARIQILLSLLKENHPLLFNQTKALFAGIAGASTISNQEQLTEAIQLSLPVNCLIMVDHDAVIALYSGTFGKSGAVHIAGTGSVSYGIDLQSKRHRVGGWGYLIGDEGSGFSIGKAGLHAAFQAHDEIISETTLSEKITRHFQVTKLPDVIPHVYGDTARQTIASLAQLVMEAADENDAVAKQIITSEAKQIGVQLATLLNKMTIQTEHSFPVILTGGVMQRVDLFEDGISSYLQQHVLTHTHIMKAALPPVVGAVIGALQLAQIPLNEAAFTSQFNQDRDLWI